jgi:DMSO/TMAO reductase YedYZ molybdopterin-dependent catalytic subunit
MGRLTRRHFLYLTAGTVAATIAGCLPRKSGQGTLPPTPIPPPTSTPVAVEIIPAAPTAPAGSPLTADEASGAPITPNQAFFKQYYRDAPRVDADTWKLAIDGLVDNPVELTYDEIRSMPGVTEMRTVECISNPAGGPLIGNAVWRGISLRNLLVEAGVKPEALQARFEAADGYQTSVPVERIAHPATLLVYEMNGEPLPQPHGFPLRLLMPGLYGQKMPKWITRIEFIDKEFKGYWESQGWSDQATVKTTARIDEPATGATVRRPVVLSGIAYAGDRAITRVEVGVDGEEWHEARLLNGPTPYAWSRWQYEWPGAPGRHVLLVRATDSTGFVQSVKGDRLLDNTFPAGTDAIHWIVVQAES